MIRSRRRLLTGCGVLVTGALTGPALAGYAWCVEPGRLAVSVRDVRLPRLPQSLDGLTIAHLSDLHVGAFVSADHVARAVELANELEPDLVVLTGDFVYRDPARIHEGAVVLAELRPRVATVAVLGNHDVWTDPDLITSALGQAGVTVLRDEFLPLDFPGARLWLMGLEDRGYSGHRGGSTEQFLYRWSGAVRAAERLLRETPAAESRLLLVHNPDITEFMPEGVADLALCGHTHGGQVRLPWLGPPVVPSLFGQRFAEGLVQGSQMPVHITRGVGLTPPPVRLNCPPEVAFLRLHAG